jgi:hypothetical protein
MITFTLGVVAALLAGALVWMFVTLYKLKKKFNWMTDTWKEMRTDEETFRQTYWRNREDDQYALSRRFEDSHQYIERYFVKKEDLKDNKKTLLKG